MAATNYASKNILWSFITSLADGDFVSMARLYDEALQRLHDGNGALLGRIAKVYADLSSTEIGTKARIVGNVDMTAFNYNGGVALSGLTVIVDEDTAAAQTCTFSNAVTSPTILLAQLTAQAGTNLIWSLNDSGQLVSECQTTGVGSTIALGAGTAHALIWPSPTITSPGAATDNDGTTKVGFGAYSPPVGIPWAGGMLRDFLKAQYALVGSVATNALLKTGGIMTGHITFTSPFAVVYNATFSRTSHGNWTIPGTVTDWEFAPLAIPLQSNTAQSVTTIDHELDLITGDTLDGVAVWSYHDGTPHGNLPATMPKIRIWRIPTNATLAEAVALGGADVTDPSASVATYEAKHAVTITGLAHTVLANSRYFVRYYSENGANDEPGRYLTSVVINGTSKGLPPGM